MAQNSNGPNNQPENQWDEPLHQEASTSILNKLGGALLGTKTSILKGVFYWSGKSMLEMFGREIVWAREKIGAEEMARLRGRKLVKCEHCGNYRETLR